MLPLIVKRLGRHGTGWSAEADALLGTVSDVEAARVLGISRGVVARRRRLLGKPALSPRHYRQYQPAARGAASVLRTLAECGGSQVEMARRLGVTPQRVGQLVAKARAAKETR